MRCTLPLLLSALCLAACSKPSNPDAANTPGNAPTKVKPAGPAERAYVVSCAPTGDARDLQWFESGKDQPFPGEALKAHIETLAKAGGNWNAAKKLSENRIALRIDCRAPISEFWRFIDALAAAGVYKFAVAMLQEFDPPFSNAGGGEPVWDLDARYMPLQLPTDANLVRASKEPEFSLGLNLSWRKQFSRCLLSTNFQRETLPITEVEEVFSDLLPVVAEGKRFARAEQGAYSFATKITEEALEKAAKRVKGNLAMVQLGEGGVAASQFRDKPGEHAPVAFLFLALDAVARLNQSRASQGLPPVEIQFAAGSAHGRFISTQPDAPKPVEAGRPKVAPWGDEPGELFEPRAAFTVTIEKLEKPAANGAAFGFFFAGSAQPQTFKQLEEEVRRFAAWRNVKDGHPGWDSKKGQSCNVMAVRCDIEAPCHLVYEAMLAGIDSGILRFAVAALHEFPAEDYKPITGADGAQERPLLTRLTGQYMRFDWQNSPIPHWDDQLSLLIRRNKAQTGVEFIAVAARKPSNAGVSATLKEVCPELAANDDARKAAAAAHEELVAALEKHLSARLADAPKAQYLEIGSDDEVSEFYFALVGLEAAQRVNEKLAAAGKHELAAQLPRPIPLPPEPEMKPEEKVDYPKDEPPQKDPKDK